MLIANEPFFSSVLMLIANEPFFSSVLMLIANEIVVAVFLFIRTCQ